jgi:DNA-binding beta-propeller fold protein YncE
MVRGLVAVIAGVGLAVSWLAGQQAEAATTAAPGSQLWLGLYNGSGNSYDFATAVAVSPTDGTVFTTGTSQGPLDTVYETTTAYDPVTGDQLWTALNQAGGSSDTPASIAVSPDGQTVFVTGFFGDDDTIAYNAATGAQLWISHFNVKAGLNQAKSLVIGHDGKDVYVTGYVPAAKGSGNDYLTEAYNAATGALLWQSRYAGAANGNDQGRAVAISRDDSTVYVTGRSTGNGTGYDDATIAYRAATGAKLWVARYNNSKANGNEFANAISVGPGGKTVYITGGSAGKSSNTDFATIAYRAGTGTQLWVSRYKGPASFIDSGTGLAVAPNGSTVVVTGSSWGDGSNTDYATIAYNAATGAARWTKRYAGVPGGYDSDDPAGVVISPDGGTVYVTGTSETETTEVDFATVAYSAATGAQEWVSRYDDPQHGFDGASALALSPSGNALYVAGYSSQATSLYDLTTIAYQT